MDFPFFLFLSLQHYFLKRTIHYRLRAIYEKLRRNFIWNKLRPFPSLGIVLHLLMLGHLRSTPVVDYRLTARAARFISFEDDNKRHYHLAHRVMRITETVSRSVSIAQIRALDNKNHIVARGN